MSRRMQIRVVRTGAIVAAAVLVLSGCTLVSELAGPGDSETTSTAEAGAGETVAAPEETGGAPDPGPTETSMGQDRVNIEVAIGTPMSIEGADGSEVGTFTVTAVDPKASCPNPNADANKNGTFVIVTLDISANETLGSQTDSYYGQHFDLSKLDVVDPYNATSTVGGADYDCLPAGERLTTVQPGTAAAGRLAFDVEDRLFAIGWFYGHQYFYVPPQAWGGA